MSGPSPDPVAFTRGLVLEFKVGTPIQDWPIVADRSAVAPPAILLGDGPSHRHPELPLYAPALVTARAYGATEEEAAAGFRALSDILHRLPERLGGPITRTGDVAGRAWKIKETTGAVVSQDPDTDWPVAIGAFGLWMADQ